MLSKEEATQCFKDPFFMPSGPMKDAAIAREREETEKLRKKLDGPLVLAFKQGFSVRQIARRYHKTEAEVEAKIRSRLL